MAGHLFLTSSPFTGPDEPFSGKNKFVERLSECARVNRKALMIPADPSNIECTEEHSDAIRYTMELTGICFDSYIILDDRNREKAKKIVRSSDFLILGGGHCPTQNTFFAEIGLRELLKNFRGTVFGISAGSMNCADIVYAQPEEGGEGIDPDYQKFLPGLNLTKTMLIPHYQETKNRILDGRRLFRDITFPDSFGRQFIALCDESYLYSDGITERICGDAWLIKNGRIRKICTAGKEYLLNQERRG